MCRLLLAIVLALVAATTAARAQITESYKIQTTDILLIEVVNEPLLPAKEYRVEASGEFTFPFIGPITAAGRSTVEVKAELKRLLEADYLVSAQVLVQMKEFRKQQISVSGQVSRQGLYDLPPERKTTIMEAIGMAGGLTRLARNSGIELRRPGREPMKFSVEDLRNPDKVVYVESGDVIFVPESRI